MRKVSYIILFFVLTLCVCKKDVYAFSVDIDGETIELAAKESKKERFYELYNYFKEVNKDVATYSEPEVLDGSNVLYLTFDDGPKREPTTRILDTLDKYNIKATFFLCNTSDIDLVERIYKSGHTIGLHTDTHKFIYLYQDEVAYLENIYKVDEQIYKYTGRHAHIIRFPGGTGSKMADIACPGIMDRLIKIIRSLGFEYYDWHIDCQDSTNAYSFQDLIYQNYMQGLNQTIGAKIVLFHDVCPSTSKVLDRIIKDSMDMGYEFKKIDSHTKPKHFRASQ